MPLAASTAGDIIFWVIILIALVLVLGMGALWLRRWTKEEEAPPSGGLGFTLHDLQELRRSGKLTDAEYEKLRAEVLAKTKAALQPPADPRP